MKIGIIIQTNEPEKAWNAVRFGNTALKQGHEVKIFLISAGVEIENITHEKYNAKLQIEEFSKKRGGNLCVWYVPEIAQPKWVRSMPNINHD